MMKPFSGIRTHVFIGGREVFRAPGIWIDSARHEPLSRAGLMLPDPAGDVFRSVAAGDAVEIRFGYRDEAPAVWRGTVSWRRPGNTKDQVEIGAVGEEKPLSTVKITQAWENETPEAIIRWAVERSGLTIGRIDSPGVIFPRYVASDIPAWQVARQCAHTCRRAFDLDMSRWALWRDTDSAVNWGDFDAPGDVPEIVTAANLITHLPAEDAAGLNRVETFLMAGMRHSQLFRLRDRRRGIDEAFRALRVRHEIVEIKARTYVWYGEEYGKF